MNKKTKVMPSSLSNPKHKLRKGNGKSKRKNKHHEKILIEKLKELTLSSKNESAQKRMQLIHKDARRWFRCVLQHV